MCFSPVSPCFGIFPTPFPHIRHSHALCTSWPALILIPVGRNDDKSLIANVSILLLNHFWEQKRAEENRTLGQPEFGASRGPRHETIVAIFARGNRDCRHNTFPKCHNYKPFRLERMAAICKTLLAFPPTCRMAGVYVHRQREVSQSLPLMVT